MRIQQALKSYALQSRLRPDQPAASGSQTGGASRANQARVTDSAKGFVQAAKVRDGVAAVSDSIARARKALKLAEDPNISAADKKKQQEEFVKALSDLDRGSKDQTAALADQSLANRTYDAKRSSVSSADGLGKGVSIQYGSVAELKNVDVTTASSDQLAEAAKVLAAAEIENNNRLTASKAKVDGISGRLDVLQSVQAALDGTKQTANTDNKKRDIESLRALIERNQSLVPGSIFSQLG